MCTLEAEPDGFQEDYTASSRTFSPFSVHRVKERNRDFNSLVHNVFIHAKGQFRDMKYILVQETSWKD